MTCPDGPGDFPRLLEERVAVGATLRPEADLPTPGETGDSATS